MMFVPSWLDSRVLFCALVLIAYVHLAGPW